MKEQTRFLLIGAYNTGFGYLMFVILYRSLHDLLHYLVIVTLAHLISVTNSFLLQRWIVFHDTGPLLPAFLRFNVATVGTLLYGLMGMALLVDGLGSPPVPSQAIITLTSALLMYLTHKHYTFRAHIDTQSEHQTAGSPSSRT